MGMSFFKGLLNQAADALRSPAPTVEGAPFQFDDGAASTIIVDPPSKILEHAVRELQGMGEGNLGRKLEVSSIDQSRGAGSAEGTEGERGVGASSIGPPVARSCPIARETTLVQPRKETDTDLGLPL